MKATCKVTTRVIINICAPASLVRGDASFFKRASFPIPEMICKKEKEKKRTETMFMVSVSRLRILFLAKINLFRILHRFRAT